MKWLSLSNRVTLALLAVTSLGCGPTSLMSESTPTPITSVVASTALSEPTETEPPADSQASATDTPLPTIETPPPAPVIPTQLPAELTPTPAVTSTSAIILVTTLPPETAGLILPPGYEARVVASGLQQPTQMILGPDGELWVAQLAGDENAGQGQVVAISLTSGEQRVLLDGLLKPTGLAVLADALWLAAGRDLLRTPLDPNGEIGPVETILTDLPFNGRSEGTLTVSPTGRLIFETSGQRRGTQAVEGSARLWELDPADPTNPRPIATGLKNAYAHTFDATGRLWLTDIHDDPVNDEAPPDELNLWLEGADFGWPGCFGLQQAALNYDGSEENCRTTRAPVALFPPHSTPTSVVVSPWAENTLLVALWGPPSTTIVQVSFTLAGDNAMGQVEPFLSGLQNPQHLLVMPDGSLLASDFRAGVVYRISRS